MPIKSLHVAENGVLHRRELGVDENGRGGALLYGDVGILEAVAREGADDAAALGDLARLHVAHGAGQGGGGGGLAEDPFPLGQQLLRGEDLLVGAFVEPAARLLLRVPRLVPGLGMTDADGGGHGFGVIHGTAAQEGSGTGRLVTHHDGRRVDDAVIAVLGVALPVGGDVAGVAHRQAVVIGSRLELLHDLEGSGLLPLDAEGVDGVDDGHRGLFGNLLHQAHAVVEVAAQLDGDRAVHHGLGQLAHGDLALGNEHEGSDAGARRIGRRRGGGVAGGGADHRLAPLIHRLGHRHGHATVLEGASGVEPLVLDVDVHLLAQLAWDVVEADERRVALAQADDAGVVVDRQAVAVLVDESGVAGTEWHGLLILLLFVWMSGGSPTCIVGPVLSHPSLQEGCAIPQSVRGGGAAPTTVGGPPPGRMENQPRCSTRMRATGAVTASMASMAAMASFMRPSSTLWVSITRGTWVSPSRGSFCLIASMLMPASPRMPVIRASTPGLSSTVRRR